MYFVECQGVSVSELDAWLGVVMAAGRGLSFASSHEPDKGQSFVCCLLWPMSFICEKYKSEISDVDI